MPNYCNYEMRIRGSRESVDRVLACLMADYNYYEGKPSHKHFFRVFEARNWDEWKNGDGTFTKTVCGSCAWSVYMCMCSGGLTYYDRAKGEHPETFMGTTLAEQSKDCEIEVFSEETGVGFGEHYIFKGGECQCDDTVDVQSAGYDGSGNATADIDWSTYDGDILCLDPHREDQTDGYLWEIC